MKQLPKDPNSNPFGDLWEDDNGNIICMNPENFRAKEDTMLEHKVTIGHGASHPEIPDWLKDARENAFINSLVERIEELESRAEATDKALALLGVYGSLK